MDKRGGIRVFLSKNRFFSLAIFFLSLSIFWFFLTKTDAFLCAKKGYRGGKNCRKMIVNAIFNATVCILGILILSTHTVNLIVKKGKRKDEKSLLDFFVFTIVHFATYLVFTLVKVAYVSLTRHDVPTASA